MMFLDFSSLHIMMIDLMDELAVVLLLLLLPLLRFGFLASTVLVACVSSWFLICRLVTVAVAWYRGHDFDFFILQGACVHG
jgi:hypothetical protein